MQLAFPLDKRWRDRQERWAPPESRDLFRPAEFGVDEAPESRARALVEQHHYSGSFPAARLSVGLYRKTGVGPAALVGVAVFSVGMQLQAIPAYSGLPAADGVELGRFVCLDGDVAFNGETWFLRRALRLLKAEKPVRAVLSYADPLERRTAGGLLTKPAHAGQIYQAHNAVYAGRSSPRWVWLDAEGRMVSLRGLSKIRAKARGEDDASGSRAQGWAGAVRQLVAAGADPRREGEGLEDWLGRVLRAPTFRRVRHPGNHAYLFGLDVGAKQSIAAATRGGKPYPRTSTRRS